MQGNTDQRSKSHSQEKSLLQRLYHSLGIHKKMKTRGLPHLQSVYQENRHGANLPYKTDIKLIRFHIIIFTKRKHSTNFRNLPSSLLFSRFLIMVDYFSPLQIQTYLDAFKLAIKHSKFRYYLTGPGEYSHYHR